MAVDCPYCGRGLTSHVALALPGDSRSDEIRFQLFFCRDCQRGSLGAYEESRRGSLESEAWDQSIYPVSEQGWRYWHQLTAGCPDTEDENCQCCAHQELRRYGEQGRWQRP